ncbi:hypothetical protein [Brevibacterium sp.]|uniref:hypothetical protein n=1 Tax=Brevibacterium sp. TaxID=1701 RepID=UPI0025BCAC66|nr:hypothetical protein [Brevibacterium sp.]
MSYVLAEASGKLIEVDADEGCRGAWNGRRHLRFWNDIDDSRTILRGEHQLQTAQL